MFPENGPTYQITEAVFWTCSEAQQQEAVTAVEFSLRSAPEAMIAKALYELRVVTRGRVNREAGDDEAEAIIFTERLRQFPADIVLDTLRNWHTRSDGQWWPTWHDLHKAIEPQATARRMLAEHIRSGACLGKPMTASDERDDSAEGIARRRQFIEQQLARFKREEEAKPKPRDPNEIAREIRSASVQLSDEAKALFREQAERAIPSPAEQFDEWDQRQPTTTISRKEVA
jgi:hypothetical protein